MTTTQTMQALCRATRQWGIQMETFCPADMDIGVYFQELRLAAPGLTDQDYRDLQEGEAILTFPSREACYAVYDLIVGDDGPTEGNPYNGKARIYAVTCDDTGQLRSENT